VSLCDILKGTREAIAQHGKRNNVARAPFSSLRAASFCGVAIQRFLLLSIFFVSQKSSFTEKIKAYWIATPAEGRLAKTYGSPDRHARHCERSAATRQARKDGSGNVFFYYT